MPIIIFPKSDKLLSGILRGTDSAILVGGCVAGLILNNSRQRGIVLPGLASPNLSDNRRVFRMLPVNRETWADAVWVQLIALPLGIFLCLSLLAALIGKLAAPVLFSALSAVASAAVFLCADIKAGKVSYSRKGVNGIALLVLLYMNCAMLGELSFTGFVPLHFLSTPAGALAALALGLWCLWSSFNDRHRHIHGEAVAPPPMTSPKERETPTHLPPKRILDKLLPFLDTALLMVFLNVCLSILACLLLLAPTPSGMLLGEYRIIILRALLAASVLSTLPASALQTRLLVALPMGRRRLAWIFTLSAVLQVCANLAVTATVVLCAAMVFGQGEMSISILYFIPACVGMAVPWYAFNFSVGESQENLMLVLFLVGFTCMLPGFAPGVWALYAGLVFLPFGVHLGFRISLRALHQSGAYKQPAWEMFPRELPRSW